jgi:O-glycosyl hydrolase
MKTNSFAGTGLAFAFFSAFNIVACSTPADDPPGKGGTGGSGPLGGTGGTVTAGTGGTGGGAGNVQTGGAGGGLPTGGAGGAVTAGTGGSVAGVGGTPPIAGAAGTPPLGGSGGDAGGGLGGAAGSGAGAAGTGNTTDVTVQLGMQRQLMRGFGINNNWAPAMTDAVADRLFGMGAQQLGLNVLRIGMGSNGEPYNGQSCYDDINKFVQRGGEYVIGTLWSPPANCKDNNSIIDGGHLLESCYESWSNTIAAFPGKISQNSNGELYAMSPQNEVDFASCGRSEPCNGNYDTTVMTGAEAAAFQKIVGPKLRAANTIPMSPEASEWIHVWSNESACCSVPSNLPSSDPLDCGFPPTNCPAGAPFDDGYEYGYALWADPAAWAAFDIMGTHQYDSQIAYAWPSDVTEKKEVWQTEMSGVKWWPEQGEVDNNGVLTTCSTHIENGVAVARWIHSGITVGEASAWLYWWYQAIDTDDNEGLICKDGRVAKRLWTMGQFSKFIRPGHHMVTVTGTLPDKVLLAASVGPNNTPVVIVAINETTAAVNIPIHFAGGTAPTAMDVVQTSATDDLAQKDPVTLTGGVLEAALPAMTVTTFISM